MGELKCDVCGKKFESSAAIKQHSEDKHPKKEEVKKTIKLGGRAVMAVIALIVISISAFLILNDSSDKPAVGKYISQSLYENVTGVDDAVLNSIGRGKATGLTRITDTPLVSDGKPLVLYIGADYCPYCAIERWGLVLALSKFGNFTGLEYMLSSPTDIYPNTPTFSFEKMKYQSDYISFQGVETRDRYGQPLQPLTTEQTASIQAHDPTGGIPYINIGNKYVVTGAQYKATVISGADWSKIANGMNDPNSEIAKSIDGSANILISAICEITGREPADVCGQDYAKITTG